MECQKTMDPGSGNPRSITASRPYEANGSAMPMYCV